MNDYIRSTNRRPDFIFACEVIEHLRDPVAFVVEALDALPSGGILVVTTPQKLDLAPRTVWDTELPPVHLWWLTKGSFVAISERVDCPVTFTDFTDYYKVTDGVLKPLDARLPVLDAGYNLIQPIKPPGHLAPLKKALREALPPVLVKRLKRASLGAGQLRSNATSETIGALFTKN